MKKLLTFTIIVLVLVLALASCGGKEQITTTTTQPTLPPEPPVHEHTIVIDEAVEATCTSTGLTEGKHCSECGEVLVAQEATPLAPHTEEIIPAVEATCTQTGLTEGKKCSICETVLVAQMEAPMIAHSYDDKYDESCNECGFIRDAECAHLELVTVEGYDATCTSTGLSNGSKCKKCGEIMIEQQIIPIKAHTPVVDPAIASTCTSTGLTEGSHCEVCRVILVGQSIIDKIPHTYGSWITISEPTVTKEGVKERSCKCGAKETKAIAKLTPSRGLEFELNSDGKSYSVTGIGTCTSTKLIIPAVYNGLPVTEIGHAAFQYCGSFTSVIIPDSVTRINHSAFHRCSELINVSIPDSVSYIDSYGGVFSSCDSLTSIIVDEDNKWYKSIDGNLYNKRGDELLCYTAGKQNKMFTIPDSVKYIGFEAFAGCDSLISITISDSVRNIEYGAFANCFSLTSITIPNSVTSVDRSAFTGCYSLVEVCNKSSLNIIDSLGGYTKHIITDESDTYLRHIGDYVFYDDGTDVYLVKYTGNETELTLPKYDGGKKYVIDNYTFYRDDKITKVTIPNSVTSIGREAFYGCTLLISINFDGTVEQWNAISWKTVKYTIYCTDGEITKDGTITYYEN